MPHIPQAEVFLNVVRDVGGILVKKSEIEAKKAFVLASDGNTLVLCFHLSCSSLDKMYTPN